MARAVRARAWLRGRVEGEQGQGNGTDVTALGLNPNPNLVALTLTLTRGRAACDEGGRRYCAGSRKSSDAKALNCSLLSSDGCEGKGAGMEEAEGIRGE